MATDIKCIGVFKRRMILGMITHYLVKQEARSKIQSITLCVGWVIDSKIFELFGNHKNLLGY